jgi:hypothetical protein
MLVQEGIYERFVKRLSEVMNKELKVGDGLDPSTTQGPLINKAAVDKVRDLCKFNRPFLLLFNHQNVYYWWYFILILHILFRMIDDDEHDNF